MSGEPARAEEIAPGATRVAAAALLRAAARGEPAGVPHLVVEAAGAPPRRVALSGELTVGRGPVASLRLADAGVSRLHARFVVGPDGEVTVEDLGSKNGVRRGGLALGRGPFALAPGEAVVVGETRLVLADPLEGEGGGGGAIGVGAGAGDAVEDAVVASSSDASIDARPRLHRLLGVAAALLAAVAALLAGAG